MNVYLPHTVYINYVQLLHVKKYFAHSGKKRIFLLDIISNNEKNFHYGQIWEDKFYNA